MLPVTIKVTFQPAGEQQDPSGQEMIGLMNIFDREGYELFMSHNRTSPDNGRLETTLEFCKRF